MSTEPVRPIGDQTLTFNGTSDFVQLENQDAINFAREQDFTVMAWIKAEAEQKNLQQRDNDIIEKWSSGTPNPYPYVIRFLNQTDGSSAGTIVAARYDGARSCMVRSTSRVDDGAFHHVAFVRQTKGGKGMLHLYIDGKRENSIEDTLTGETRNDSPLYLGRRGADQPYSNFFAGAIKGLAIYSVGLSSDEIEQSVHGGESAAELKTITGLDFQHAWAGTSADQIGSATLEAAGNPVQGAPVRDLADTPLTRGALQFADNTTDAMAAATPDIGDINDTSMLVACLFRTRSGAPSGLRSVVGKRAPKPDLRGWEVQYDAKGTLIVAVDTGDNRVASQVGRAHTDNAWHVFVMVYDNASKQVRFASDLGQRRRHPDPDRVGDLAAGHVDRRQPGQGRGYRDRARGHCHG
jgi:hypothetical protein